VVTKCRQAVTNSSACLVLGWRMADSLFRLALVSRRQALLVDIFLLLFAIPGHSLVWIFGTKLPIYKKDIKMGISGKFRSM